MEDFRENNTPDTSGQQGQYNQQNQYGQYGQSPDPQASMQPTIMPPKKKSKAAIITVLVVIAIVVIMVVTLAPSYIQARKFGKAIVKGTDSDKIGEMMFPKDLVKKGGDVYDLYEKLILTEMTDEIQRKGNASFLGVKPGKAIKKSSFRYYEKYYKLLYQGAGLESKVKIQKGYEYKIQFKAGGQKYYTECSVIKIKGEGWKVFPVSAKDIKEISSDLGL